MIYRFICLTTLLLAGCEDVDVKRTIPTMPVTVMELAIGNVARERELTGVVSHYREQQVGFEVDGRVTAVLDEGIEVRGPAFDESGKLLREGDPIAVMEGSRYGSQVGALQAQLNAARRDLQAVQAQFKLAQQTLKRQKQILKKGVGRQQAVDDAKSSYDQSRATVEAKRASVVAVEQQLNRATEDLGDAVLYAPFSGRITQVHIAEGAVVSSGSPVVTLTLMDPMQVQVEVSADVERDIETGDRAVVYLKHPFDPDVQIPINAVVYEKSAVADPKLRTFKIVLMIRNSRYHIQDRDESLRGLPVANEYLPVAREYQGEEGPLFVPTEALLHENGKYYVFRLPDISFNKTDARSTVGKHIPQRVEVKLGDEYTNVVQWNFRSVVEDDSLAEGEFLLMNPQSDYTDGVVIGRPQWLLRPNDLVPVRFDLSQAPEGLYVPNHAIILIDETPHVYRVKDGKAIATSVTLHENVANLRRISSDEVQPGVKIVVDGVHYLTDAQPVSVARVE